MQKIAMTLESNVKEIRYGSVSVKLHIHDGKIVKMIYKASRTSIEHPVLGEKRQKPSTEVSK
jgi:hypothetical protein